MSQGLYLIGFMIVIGGVAYMAHLMHLPTAWIGAIVLVLLGIGVVTMVQTTRHKDPNYSRESPRSAAQTPSQTLPPS